MLKAIKHIAIVVLCLFVVCGAVGTHFYVFVCSQQHHAAQLALTYDHHDCCADEHDTDGECHHHDGATSVSDENSCCQTSSQVLSVSSFDISKIVQLSKVAMVATLINTLFHMCDHGCGHVVEIVYSSGVYPSHLPDIYSFGQLRL